CRLPRFETYAKNYGQRSSCGQRSSSTWEKNRSGYKTKTEYKNKTGYKIKSRQRSSSAWKKNGSGCKNRSGHLSTRQEESDDGITNHQLDVMLKNEPYFRGVFAADTLPTEIRPYESGIVNLSPMASPGTHWVAYYN